MPAGISTNNMLQGGAGTCRHCLILLAFIVFAVDLCCADVYSWTDDAGATHFTDSAESVPKKYRHNAEVRSSETGRSWEYLASEHGADYLYDPSSVTYKDRNRFLVLTKESYSRGHREEYETQIILDCARQMYKPVHSVRIDLKNRRPVDLSETREETPYSGYTDGFKRYSHPYLVLSRMICSEKRP